MRIPTISPYTLLGRMVRLPLRVIPSGMHMPILTGAGRGMKWIVGSSDHGCWLGSFEYGKQKLLAGFVKEGDVVWDLGANVGFYSLLSSALAGKNGHVFSFEPSAGNLKFLRRHLQINSISNCTVIEAAVSRKSGIGRFHMDGLATDHLAGESEAGTTVTTVSLDDLVFSGSILPPSVIKCDIEGAEYEALLGRPRPWISTIL